MNREVDLCEQRGDVVCTVSWSCVNSEVELC